MVIGVGWRDRRRGVSRGASSPFHPISSWGGGASGHSPEVLTRGVSSDLEEYSATFLGPQGTPNLLMVSNKTVHLWVSSPQKICTSFLTPVLKDITLDSSTSRGMPEVSWYTHRWLLPGNLKVESFSWFPVAVGGSGVMCRFVWQ